eukprot:TRINITY_DN36979_c0_g1_i1.p1 TRINITY_DN36979_c0_g1~~TRINITY_DN36979_c0_g1_i1.p1  ORF type:complete len:975 (-),score=161.74 TRINITY_DN36979_c0_g1_i1:65-2989(-)
MSGYLDRELPWCTIILVSLAMLCHIMVLSGNMQTASTVEAIGSSSKGWSNVGLDMAGTFAVEIDDVMSNMTEQLTDGIEKIMALEKMLDSVIGAIGVQTEKSMAQLSLLQYVGEPDEGKPDAAGKNPLATIPTDNASAEAVAASIGDGDDFGNIGEAIKSASKILGGSADPISKLKAVLDILIDSMMAQVGVAFDKFLDILEPTLLKVGEWYTRFGDKLQAGIEQFSLTVDNVQKMLDQIMAQSGAGGEGAEYMEHNTFTLFAMSNPEVGISVQDLKDLSDIYSITSLQGEKAENLHGKYDVNQDAAIDTEEYSSLVFDSTMPGVMPLVLRSYSKKLAEVAGIVEKAKMRDEVANAIVRYLQLVAVKNLTKVGWISERLTNSSLPLAFTACVMKNLAQLADDPEVLSSTDVGSIVISTMASIDHSVTMQAADLMANTTFWVSEGFDPADQPVVVQRVSEWTAASLIETGSWEGLARLHQFVGVHDHRHALSLLESGAEGTSMVIKQTGASARRLVERNRREYFARRHESRAAKYRAHMQSRATRVIYDALLGGQLVYHNDPVADAAVSSGSPAVPETLEFAKWLSWNATRTAAEFQSACFNYSGMSSTPADAFATQIQGMVKKIQSFMSMLAEYAGEEGMARLREKVADFLKGAKAELLDAIVGQLVVSKNHRSHALLQISHEVRQPAGGAQWLKMVGMLETIQAMLPQVIDNLKLAREQVSSISKVLDSLFSTFKSQGLPIFKQLAGAYRMLWFGWFFLLASFSLGILYYGFWASGWFGGPKAPENTDDEPEPPTGFVERCKCLGRACYTAICCCSGPCCYPRCVFWSLLLLGQLFVLVMFIISLVLCIVSGIKMFLASGCSAIYVLGDEKTCTETLKMMQSWLTSFQGGAPELEIEEVCTNHALMTCAVIQDKLTSSAILTAVGAVLASVVTFQLLIESAILFERAQNRRLIDAMLKEGSKAEGSGSEQVPP